MVGEDADDGDDLVLLGLHGVERAAQTAHQVGRDLAVHELMHLFTATGRVKEQQAQLAVLELLDTDNRPTVTCSKREFI